MKIFFNIITIIVFWIFNIQIIQAQCDQNINTITTDPSITGGFDWRANPINAYILDPTTNTSNWTLIPNPFYSPDNLNCGDLDIEGPQFQDIRDYQPADGWELVYKEVKDEINPGIGVQNPILVLYNRYTGILRVFIAIGDRKQDYNGAAVKLEMIKKYTDTRITSMLSYATPIAKTIDNFDNSASMVKLNQWVNENFYWLYAEFPLAYDPCTCNANSVIRITGSLVQNGEINLNINGTSTQVVDGSVVNTDNPDTFTTILGDVKEGSESGLKGYKDTKDAIEETQKFVGPFTKNPKNFTMPGWVDGIPYFGALVGVADFIVAKESENDVAPDPTPMVSTLNLTASGSITQKNPFKSSDIVNPGSQKSTAPSTILPTYNNILGIFNLIETPTLEYVEYFPNYTTINLYADDAWGFVIPYQTPIIREYKLKNDFRYVINPAANLDLISIQAGYVFRTTNDGWTNPGVQNITSLNKYIWGPVELGVNFDPNLSFEDRLLQSNLELNRWSDRTNNNVTSAYYNTPFLPSDQLYNERFKLYEYDFNNKEIYIKLIVTLKPKGNPTAKEVVLAVTYPVNLTPSFLNDPSRKYYFGNVSHDGGYPSNPYYGKIQVQDLFYKSFNSTIPSGLQPTSIDPSPWGYQVYLDRPIYGALCGTYYATNNIIINSGAYISPGCNVTLIAGNDIIINPDFIQTPEFSAQAGSTIPGYINSASTIHLASSSEVTALCGSNSYNTLSTPPSSKLVGNDLQANLHSTSSFNNSSINIEISPNPMSEMAGINYTIKTDDNVSIFITDIYGQKVMDVENAYHSKGNYEINMNVNSLDAGVYFCTINSGYDSVSKRIMIAK